MYCNVHTVVQLLHTFVARKKVGAASPGAGVHPSHTLGRHPLPGPLMQLFSAALDKVTRMTPDEWADHRRTKQPGGMARFLPCLDSTRLKRGNGVGLIARLRLSLRDGNGPADQPSNLPTHTRPGGLPHSATS